MEFETHTGAPIATCDRSCCSDFANWQDPDQDKAWSFDLSASKNPILPLFAQSKIEFDGVHISEYQRQYEKIEPALRLASRMLQDDCAVHFICTMFRGTLHYGTDTSNPRTWDEIEEKERATDLTTVPPTLPIVHLTRRAPKILPAADSREESLTILNDLAGVLTRIKFLHFPDGSYGSTVGVLPSEYEVDPYTKRQFEHTVGALIKISSTVAELHKNHPSPISQYLTARSLVHEVAHVLNKACNRWRTEVFYHDSWTNEAGFELENALFGGSYEKWDFHTPFPERYPDPVSVENQVFVLEQWPSARSYYAYKCGTPPMLTRGDRQGINLYDIVSRIPLAYIMDMCTDRFWHERDLQTASVKGLNLCPMRPRNLVSWVLETFDPEKSKNNFLPHSEIGTYVLYEPDDEYTAPAIVDFLRDVYEMKRERLRREEIERQQGSEWSYYQRVMQQSWDLVNHLNAGRDLVDLMQGIQSDIDSARDEDELQHMLSLRFTGS